MAVITRQVQKHSCDICGSEADYCYQCAGCQKDICYQCRESDRVKMYHAQIYFDCTSDPCYCRDCDKSAQGTPLHTALVSLHDMRDEAKRFSDDFSARQKALEEKIAKLTKGN